MSLVDESRPVETAPEIGGSARSDSRRNPAEPYVRIRPSSGWRALDLREVWRYRDLLLTFVGRDLKLRYKQTALGVSWVVLQPLLAAGIFAVVFGGVARLDAPGAVPYLVFSYAGLLGWNLFAGTVTKATGCLVENSQLISKTYFPRLVMPLSQAGSAFVDFAVASVMMALLMAAFGVAPTWRLMLLPLWVIGLLAAALGAGLLGSSLAVSYRDVKHALPVAVQTLLYASPVAYSLEVILERVGGEEGPVTLKERLITWFFYANPLTGLLEGFRWSVLGEGALVPGQIVYSAVAAAGLLVFGCYHFRRHERRFADVI